MATFYYNGFQVQPGTARNAAVNAGARLGNDPLTTELIFEAACCDDGEEQRDILLEYGIEIITQ